MKHLLLLHIMMLIFTTAKGQFEPAPLKVNTFYGYRAFYSNASGNNNTAIGPYALYRSETGNHSTAVGGRALYNSTAGNNTAVGSYAGFFLTTGSSNTILGRDAMREAISAGAWTVVGQDAGRNQTGGYWHTHVGHSAGLAFGAPTADNVMALGYAAQCTASNQVRIGNEFVQSIGGHVSWSTLSDGRFKREIKEDVAGLDFISKLRPVSYLVDEEGISRALKVPDSVINELKSKSKPSTRQTGFVAQEVEQLIKSGKYTFSGVNAPQNEVDHYSIRYSDFVVPLVKAVQELNAKIAEQQKTIEALMKISGAGAGDAFRNPQDASLQQNQPNPFSADTYISMSVPDDVRLANLIIYSIEGKQLKTMPVLERGAVNINVQSTDLSNGIYLYGLMTDARWSIQKNSWLPANSLSR